MNDKKNLLRLYGVQTAIALMIAVGGAYAFGFDPSMTPAWWCRSFSDGFFLAAMLFIGFGGLMWVSTTGFFDMFSYGFSSLLVLFTGWKNPKEHKHFYEYKMEKEAKREGKGWPASILFVGLGCLVLSLLLLGCYYMIGGQ